MTYRYYLLWISCLHLRRFFCERYDFHLRSSPDKGQFSGTGVAKPEALIQKRKGTVRRRPQVGRGNDEKKFALVKIPELLRTLWIGALGKHRAPHKSLAE